MTDTVKLKQKIKESGYRISYIANALDLSYYGFKKKVDNKSEFKASEIQVLCDLLKIHGKEREMIFFSA